MIVSLPALRLLGFTYERGHCARLRLQWNNGQCHINLRVLLLLAGSDSCADFSSAHPGHPLQ